MSIATEITRLQGAKSDLKTSIEAKGVTVPSATLISGYAALVDQIQGGGAPDSDGLADIVIANGDMTDSASSITLMYTPTYLLRYAPSSPISNRSGLTISQSVTYPSIVWSCSDPSITISGATATIPTGFDDDVVLTATWTDYDGDTQTSSKTVHFMNLAYAWITITETTSTSGYFVTRTWPDNIGVSSYEEYGQGYICTGTATPPSWGGGYKVLSNNGTSAALFATVDEAKAAIDTL